MSRNEGRIGAGGEAAGEAAEILAQIEADAASRRLPRPAAVARYLSAAEGWRDASATLGGAFAPAARNGDG
ncbi:MAG: hypothetical protein WKF52_09535 [Sphingomicrobium sp.]